MGVIKRSDVGTHARDAIAMDLSDVQRRADAVVHAAQEEASAILERARAERERLIASAREVGHEEGYERGHAEGLERGAEAGHAAAREEAAATLSGLERAWTEALDAWEHERRDLMHGAKTEVVHLAARIATRVVKRTVELDPEVVVDQLEAVLETLVSPTDLRIHANPGDTELLERVAPSMVERCAQCAHASIVPDPSLAPGSCVAKTKGGGEVDASIARQIDRIVASMLPAHRGEAYDGLFDEDRGIDGGAGEQGGHAA